MTNDIDTAPAEPTGLPAVHHNLRSDEGLADLAIHDQPVGLRGAAKFDHGTGTWHLWDGIRWAPDRDDGIHRRLLRCLDGWTLATTDADTRKSLATLLNLPKQRSVLDALSHRDGIALTGDEWDLQPNLLGCDNGIVDLDTGELRPGDPADLVTRSTGLPYNPNAEMPTRFLAFLTDVLSDQDHQPQPELVEYVLLALGASLYGHTRVQQFYGLIGPGNAGKGTLMRLVKHCLGHDENYCVEAAPNLYARQRYGTKESSAPRPDLLRLKARRIAYLDEPEGPFNTEMLKAHSGEAAITARDLYAKSTDTRTWVPTHTIMFSANRAPAVDDFGTSMRRRVRIIPFLHRYDADRDPNLDAELKAEAPAVLALLVRFAKVYNDNPLRLMDPDLVPDQVKEASATFVDDSDPLSAFLTERCYFGPKLSTKARVLYEAYVEWSVKHDDDPMKEKPFGTIMGSRLEKKKLEQGISYKGVALRDQGESEDPSD